MENIAINKRFQDLHFDSIQALRGLAALFVVFQHIRFLNFGAFGVDIFFCISGFMIMFTTEKSTKYLQRKRQQAEQREMRLKYLSPANRIREKRTYSIQLEERLENRMQTILRGRRHTLALYIERMKAVSPLEKLNSGFSYVEAADGKNIRSVTQVHEGDSLRIRVSDGVIDTKVEQVQQGDRFTV